MELFSAKISDEVPDTCNNINKNIKSLMLHERNKTQKNTH
jgi:hypothetical protein